MSTSAAERLFDAERRLERGEITREQFLEIINIPCPAAGCMHCRIKFCSDREIAPALSQGESESVDSKTQADERPPSLLGYVRAWVFLKLVGWLDDLSLRTGWRWPYRTATALLRVELPR